MSLTSEEINTEIKATTMDFVKKEFELDDADMVFVEEAIDKQLAENSRLLEQTIELLSDAQVDIFKKIEVVMTDNDKDLQSLDKRLSIIEVKAQKDLEGEELEVMLSAISVAKNTLQYWHDNNSEWQKIQNSEAACIQSKDFNWKDLGKADVSGGVCAAAGGGVAWLLGAGPVGWKAWAAVFLSGAVAGSAQNAIDQLW